MSILAPVTQRFAQFLRARAPRVGSNAFSLLVSTWEDGQPEYPDFKITAYHKDGFTKNELIYACINATANTAAVTRLDVLNRRDRKVVADHPLRMLLERPNPYFSEFDFWAMTIICLKLAGASYWLKVRSKAGLVVQLWPLRPDALAPIKSTANFIDSYQYTGTSGTPVSIPARDVFSVIYHDPIDLFKPLSPIRVLSRAGDVDNRITDHLDKFFAQGARPPGIFKSKLKLMETDITRILKSIEGRYGGVENWHKPMVLDSDSEYQRTGMTMQEMDFQVLDARNEARICMVLETPPIIVGARVGLDAGTYSNFEQSRQGWWEDKLTPLYKKLSDAVDLQLAPEFGDTVVSQWDFSKVPAYQAARNAAWSRATAALQAGAITLNQFNREVGLPEIPDGDVYLRPINVQAVRAGDVAAPTAPAAMPTGDSQPGQSQQNAAPLPALVKAVSGTPLPHADAVAVPKFGQSEIDGLFDAWKALPSLAELRAANA